MLNFGEEKGKIVKPKSSLLQREVAHVSRFGGVLHLFVMEKDVDLNIVSIPRRGAVEHVGGFLTLRTIDVIHDLAFA